MAQFDASILLVEDNPDDQILTIRALRKASSHTQIILQEDGQAALEFLFGSEQSGPSALVESLGIVLLDIKLPKVGGLEVLRQIRASSTTDWLPVVMMTSTDEPQELREAYRLGANSFVTKHIDYSRFSDQMSLLARYWLTVNQVPAVGANRSY